MNATYAKASNAPRVPVTLRTRESLGCCEDVDICEEELCNRPRETTI